MRVHIGTRAHMPSNVGIVRSLALPGGCGAFAHIAHALRMFKNGYRLRCISFTPAGIWLCARRAEMHSGAWLRFTGLWVMGPTRKPLRRPRCAKALNPNHRKTFCRRGPSVARPHLVITRFGFNSPRCFRARPPPPSTGNALRARRRGHTPRRANFISGAQGRGIAHPCANRRVAAPRSGGGGWAVFDSAHVRTCVRSRRKRRWKRRARRGGVVLAKRG